MTILIAEDDGKIGKALCSGLESEGYNTTLASDGPTALQLLKRETFDLAILDWMLPGLTGLEILSSLGHETPRPPVLLLTARDSIGDRVLGLDSGADDYLVKPFAFSELLARLRALLRRSGQEETARNSIADLVLDPRERRVSRADIEIPLTPREFDFLAYLMRHAGQTVTRQMLATDVWREPNRSTPLDNVIDVHLARLRKKIDDGHPVRLLHTIRGIGFLCGENSHPTTR